MGLHLLSERGLLLRYLFHGGIDRKVEGGSGDAEADGCEAGCEEEASSHEVEGAVFSRRLGFDETPAGGNERVVDFEAEAAGSA